MSLQRDYQLLNLKAITIPTMAPIALKNIEEKVNSPAPHSVGTKPPAIDPIIVPIYTLVLVLIVRK